MVCFVFIICSAQSSILITDHVSSILENEPASTNVQIPPAFVFYAIRNILRPTLILGQIPDLLDCLAMVDTFRRYAIETSSVALSWQEYYMKELSSDPDMTLLTERELKKLQSYVTNDERDRLHYILVIKNLCLLVRFSGFKARPWFNFILYSMFTTLSRHRSPVCLQSI
jgi:hypothetical protein